jgi:large repetitive protein
MINLRVCLASAFGLFCLCGPALAQGSFLTLSQGTGGPGSLEVTFLGGGGTAPAGLQWTLVYPLSQLSGIGATAGPAATAAAKTLSCTSDPGLFTCVLTGPNGNGISTGVVANIQLTLAANVTAASLSVSNTVGVDAGGSRLLVSSALASPPYTPPALVVSPPPNLGTIALGGSISGTVRVSGGTPPYTLTASGLPPGVTFSGYSITGTPTVPGAYSVGIAVTDAAGNTAATTIGFSVFGVVTSSLPPAITFSPYSLNITAAGGTMPYTFSVMGLPPEFSVSSGGAISGTATAAGTYTIRVTATDAGGVSNSASFSFAVNLPAPLTVPGGSLPDATVLTPYSQILSAVGGAPPYTWTLVGGSVPDGTSLQSNGTVAGAPGNPGSYMFTARATDQTGTSALGTFSLKAAPAPLTITTPSPLTSGMITVDYPLQVISATGGVGPYTFAVSVNSLPAGLTLSPNGAISGTPTVVGTFSFTLTATDSNGLTGSAPFRMTVRPFSADLLISGGSLSFSLAAGTTPLQGTQVVQVQSTDVTKVLSWSASTTPATTWLSVESGSGMTPGFFSVALTSAASSLAASATPYQATIVVSCAAPSPCAGSSQTITVLLLVSAAPPELTALTSLLSFSTSSANPQATTQSVTIENTGGGSLGFASFTCPPTWCEVNSGQIPVTITSGETVSVTADPTGLGPGYYYTDLTITTPVGTAVVPITFFIADDSNLALLPAGVQLIMPAGGVAANPDTSFLVSVSGVSPVAWTAAVLADAPWLNLTTTSGSSTAAAPGAVVYSINQTAAAALAPQVYYGTIRVTSTAAANSPQDFQVVLDVTSTTQKQQPNPSPAGLLFFTTAGGPSTSQIDQVFASSVTAVNYQASASTINGNPWLSVSPATGTTSASSPAQSSISVSPAGLAPGLYYGNVSYSLSAAAVRSVNVTLIVEPAAPTPSLKLSSSADPPAVVSCAPKRIIPTQTGLVNNFAAPASWPTALEIQLTDDCGTPVTNGEIVATFTNGDSPLALTLENPSGLYSGTWTPRNTGAQVIITATATAPGFTAATARISGSVVPSTAPALAPNGILHVFTPEVGSPLAPGTIVQIYGTGLATQTMVGSTIPLADSLAGTSVIIGGLQAPLFFVSPGQVNAQIPFELTPGQPYQVIVSNNGALSTPETIQSDAVAPGISALPSGYANAQHASDGSAVTDASPAKPGEYIVVYLAGMGATTVPVASGTAAPSSPLAQTVNVPTITLNGESVSFSFSGLTPGLSGLYQIDLQVPPDAPNGDLMLVVNQPGFQGSPVILPVHN